MRAILSSQPIRIHPKWRQKENRKKNSLRNSKVQKTHRHRNESNFFKPNKKKLTKFITKF
jgi:hypothetical protein